jgi:hypothetical protein
VTVVANATAESDTIDNDIIAGATGGAPDTIPTRLTRVVVENR